ncbi:unnamed protein product [Discula destructiva]
MATTPFAPPYNASFSPFDIFRDGGAATSAPPPQSPSLPGGPCNFNLSQGPDVVKCGCRRFWSRQTNGAGNHEAGQIGWCMCSHHACFHDDIQNTREVGSRSTTALESAPAAPWNEPGQENEKPRSNRSPLSPAQDFNSAYIANSLGLAAADFSEFDYHEFTTNLGLDMEIPQTSAQTAPAPTDGDSMPDTLSWRNVPSPLGGQTPRPAIPSQCLPPHSQSGSTTASSQMRYLRPFGGTGLNTLSSVAKSKNCALAKDEGAVPWNHGHTSNDAIIFGSRAHTSRPGISQAMGGPPPLSVVSAGGNTEALDNLTDAVNIHETRIDRLETGSIYAAAHEECSDKHDLTDLRVTDLENRVNEVEKQLPNDDASVASSRRTTQRDDDSHLHAALSAQLETLQARVNHLETSSTPSYSAPWELEVVFLPFPLKGIWQQAQEFKTARLSGGRDEWTQLPNTNTNARATPDPQIFAAYDEWAGEDSDWLLPRACVPGRVIDQRLRSRGLIKNVSLRDGDARTVQIAVGNAFRSVLRLIPNLTSLRSPYAPDSRVDRFFGLQQLWVPLRKVHKDSRLRLLSPAELLTPVLWNASFLMDSVVMKATGVHRLYITQPEAYLQDSHLFNYEDAEPSWTWQRLREFARVYPESQGSTGDSEVPEADAHELYWSHNARLDEPSRSRQPSLSPLQERAVTISRTSDGSAEQFFTGPSNPTTSMMSPVLALAHSPFVPRDRMGSHPPSSVRAGSVPPLSPPIISSPRNTRRTCSFAIIPSLAGPSYQRHTSPLVTSRASPRLAAGVHPSPLSIITKHRRRSTRSPSVRGMHNTPRWSNRSYSRSPSVGPFQHIYAKDPVRGERRVTPLAYATPHSNAPPDYLAPRLHSRSISRNGDVFEDPDENMIEGFDGDHGSSTESEDDDPDFDVQLEENDELDDIDSDSNRQVSSNPQAFQSSSSPPRGAEDNVLPGIEDNFMSDDDDEGNLSDVSVPSEYPSRQPQSMGDGREMTHGPEAEDVPGVGFPFHGPGDGDDGTEEEDDDDDDNQEPW